MFRFCRKILHYILHLCIYCAFSFGQRVFWELNGTMTVVRLINRNKRYEQSAQVMKILSRAQSKKVSCINRRNFISTHQSFVHPSYVLQPHVSLATITSTEAVFVESDQSVNMFDTSRWPFLFDAQFKTARKIITMPLQSLIRLSDEIGELNVKVIYVHSTGRSGSTLVAQFFNRMSQCVCLSEPHVLFSLRQLFKTRYWLQDDWAKGDEYRALFRCAFRLMLKPSIRSDTRIVLIKAAPMGCILDAPLLATEVTNLEQVFLYRDVSSQVLSLKKILALDPIFEITGVIHRNRVLRWILPQIISQSLVYNSCDDAKHAKWLYGEPIVNSITSFGAFVIGWASLCHHYRDLVLNDRTCNKLFAMKYEDMINNNRHWFESLLQNLNLEVPSCDWEEMLKSLQEDSQEHSYISRSKVSGRTTHLSTKNVQEANKYLDFYQLPRWGESCTLPNTKKPC